MVQGGGKKLRQCEGKSKTAMKRQPGNRWFISCREQPRYSGWTNSKTGTSGAVSFQGLVASPSPSSWSQQWSSKHKLPTTCSDSETNLKGRFETWKIQEKQDVSADKSKAERNAPPVIHTYSGGMTSAPEYPPLGNWHQNGLSQTEIKHGIRDTERRRGGPEPTYLPDCINPNNFTCWNNVKRGSRGPEVWNFTKVPVPLQSQSHGSNRNVNSTDIFFNSKLSITSWMMVNKESADRMTFISRITPHQPQNSMPNAPPGRISISNLNHLSPTNN